MFCIVLASTCGKLFNHIFRSALNSQSRDAVIVSLAGSRLDESLNRAERNSESLRDHSRSLYKSVRSSVYGASALANTL